MTRDSMLQRVRSALGCPSEHVPEAPPVRLAPITMGQEDRIRRFTAELEALAGAVYHVSNPADARAQVAAILAGRAAVASDAPLLEKLGITGLPGVQTGFPDREAFREACAGTPVGITYAQYALADTGSLVLLAESGESRLLSLLPPCHVALVASDRLLTGLDELFTLVPNPADRSSSMVLVTGTSRTGDIELTLVRGVHGPGEMHVLLIDEVT
jgi:L-lactate dehydrogenase complex protein LldG